MVKFKRLFSFTDKEIKENLARASFVCYWQGLKVLYAPAPTASNAEGKLLVVTPRACGKAHKRNLIRRRLRSIFFTTHYYSFPGTTFIFVRAPAMELSFEELQKFLMRTFDKITKQSLADQNI